MTDIDLSGRSVHTHFCPLCLSNWACSTDQCALPYCSFHEIGCRGAASRRRIGGKVEPAVETLMQAASAAKRSARRAKAAS